MSILFIVLLSFLLYGQFFDSGIIFDDHGLFASLRVYEFAQNPFDFKSRTFPYFTLGFIQVLTEDLAANRIFSLLLHISCASLLFALLRSLLTSIARNSTTLIRSQASLVSAIVAISFAIHPIAVYGVGYLAQRSGLFATFFCLLAVWFYRRSFAENRTVDVITAALFYSLAVLSKEHAIMLPAAILPLAVLYDGGWQAKFKRMALFLLLCSPAALTVLFSTIHIVASSYEPDIATILPKMQEMAVVEQVQSQWWTSIVLQAGFFFDYLAFWIVPDVRFLSADMRFDFAHIWSSWWVYPKAFLFFASPVIALYFLRKKGWLALFCCGFLYSWFLFMTELAAVRFQEPFVLYRSYLWAPGYMMMLAAVCARIPRRWLILGAIPVFVVFFMLAMDRLTSLSSEANVWKDAAAKLASPTLVGSDRIFYNRGLAYMREKKYEDAIADFSRTLQLNPKVGQAYYSRARAYYALDKYTAALSDLDQVLLLGPANASAYYTRGLILERLSCMAAARKAFVASFAAGNRFAKLKLNDLDENKDVVEKKDKSKPGTCPD
ncbi:tetratricopeptide repeat protein [Herminiimonas glaciei]|uniref:Tetratricopeptide repeat protein n=1 Tax=Herminiimonas glaciei TaxID=523788 RepID=A0ABW2IF31_9BURK